MSRSKRSSGIGAAGRVGAFLVGLGLVFVVSLGIGSLVEPADTESDDGHGAEHAVAAHGGEVGYSLRLERDSLARDERRELRFAILDAAGEPVIGYDELHERRMHLILVRRDGRGFQHLHPEIDPAGTWTVPIELGEPGVYRAFADFSVGGEQHTLAADLSVPGRFEARPFPAPDSRDSIDGYEVRLRKQSAGAGEHASLGFAVSRGGEEVRDLAPYLGAKGHLVALREGDLAYLHVHPEESSGDEVAFGAEFPTAGRYRLYLQFKHEGTVRTAEFTLEVPR